MKKTTIAVDVDEVLSPYVEGLVLWHNQKFGTTFKVQDFVTYEFHKVWGGDRDDAIRKGTEYFENRPPTLPLTGAFQALSDLKKNYELIVVTSRPLDHKPQTEAWINEHFPGIFSQVILCNHWNLKNIGPVIKKSTACMMYGAAYLIDDMPHYTLDAAEEGLTGLLFGEYPWNQCSVNHPRVQRVTDWQAITDYFKVYSEFAP